MTPRGSVTSTLPRLARLPFFYGWVVVAVAFVTMAIGVNTRTAFSLLFPPIFAEFGWQRATIAGAFSLGFVASAFYTPFIGSAMDRFGPRLVIPFGVLLVCAGLILATFAAQPWHFYLSLGVLVIGGSVFISYVGHSLILPHWFVRRRGLATGIAFSGVGVGSILLLPWLQSLIGASGWRAACWALAGLLLAVVLPLNLVLQRQRPADLGLAPDGDPGGAAAAAQPGGEDNVVDRRWAATEWTLALALREARFWWLFAAFFCGLFAWYGVLVHQTQYLTEIGFSAELAAWALGLVGFAGIAGQIVIGHLSDRIGREWAWTIAALGFVLCYLCLLALEGRPSTAALSDGPRPGPARLRPRHGLWRDPGRAVPGQALRQHLRHAQQRLDPRRRERPLADGRALRPARQLCAGFWLAIALGLLSIVCVWHAAPRKVRVVAGQVARLQASRAVSF